MHSRARARRKRAIDDAIRAHDALDVGAQVAAVQLDLEARHAIARNPLFERVRQAIVHPRPDIRGLERIAGADRMEHRRDRPRRGRDIAIEVLALELRTEIVREVARHVRRAVGFVDAHAECLAVGVVHGGVKGAGDNKRAELRDRRRQAQRARNIRRRFEILGLERPEQVDRMPALDARRGYRLQRVGQRPHRAEADVVRDGGKRPCIAERHRPEAPRVPAAIAAAVRSHATVDVEDGHAIDRAAAKLVRRAVTELLERMIDRDDPDVGGPACGDGRCRILAPCRNGKQHRRGAHRSGGSQQRAARHRCRRGGITGVILGTGHGRRL